MLIPSKCQATPGLDVAALHRGPFFSCWHAELLARSRGWHRPRTWRRSNAGAAPCASTLLHVPARQFLPPFARGVVNPWLLQFKSGPVQNGAFDLEPSLASINMLAG